MSEVKRDPIISLDANGDEIAAFDVNHSLADIARWLLRNRGEAEELHLILGDMLQERGGPG